MVVEGVVRREGDASRPFIAREGRARVYVFWMNCGTSARQTLLLRVE